MTAVNYHKFHLIKSVKIEILYLYERKNKMANRVRAKIKTLRVSPTDEIKLKRRVSESGKTMQEFLLDLALNGKVSTYDYSELMKLRKDVNAIGRNVNQIVRYIHETGAVEPEAFEMLRQEIKEMNKAIMTEFKEGNLLKENANNESTPNQED